ncbi:MAG: hypothetical protein ACYDDF_02905 [Thermoplasmatota archaeon]
MSLDFGVFATIEAIVNAESSSAVMEIAILVIIPKSYCCSR